jgi:hypothetical protein
VKGKEFEDESISDDARTALDPRTALSFGMALDSGEPIRPTAAFAARAAARINKQMVIGVALEAKSTIEKQQSVEQLIRESHSTMATDQPLEVEQPPRHPLLAMATKNALRAPPTFTNPQPSISKYAQVLSSNEHSDSYGESTAVPLFSRHALRCDNCENPGHRWMYCPHPCVHCDEYHHGYLDFHRV